MGVWAHFVLFCLVIHCDQYLMLLQDKEQPHLSLLLCTCGYFWISGFMAILEFPIFSCSFFSFLFLKRASQRKALNK